MTPFGLCVRLGSITPDGAGQLHHSLARAFELQLGRGPPFFIHIVEQGIALYEAEGYEFAEPCKLPPEEARIEAQKHLEEWFRTIAFCAECVTWSWWLIDPDVTP